VKWVKTQGIELYASHSFMIAKKINVNLQTNITWLDSKTSDSIPSFYILSHAKFLMQNNVQIRYKNWEILWQSVYKERNGTQAAAIKAVQGKAYWLNNARIQYSVNHLSVFLNVQNVGNISYSDLLGSRMPNRWASMGVKADF
jgi:iron complex outermembrane receptor protein